MNRKNLITIVISVSLVMFFASEQANAQKGIPFYLAYDSEDVIRDQSKVATITSTCGLIIDSIEVLPYNMRSANTGSSKKQIVNVDVLPGVHEVTITHDPSGFDRRLPTTTAMIGNLEQRRQSVTATPIELKYIPYDFKAGHVYVVEMHFTVIRIREITKEKAIAKIAETRNNAIFVKK